MGFVFNRWQLETSMMKLLALDAEVADYVIVHELLHFFVPNHGRLWKSLMRAHLGNYERLEAKLEISET